MAESHGAERTLPDEDRFRRQEAKSEHQHKGLEVDLPTELEHTRISGGVDLSKG